MINKLNDKGQSLVLFVILIPVLVVLFFFIFDFSIVMSNRIKLNDISKNSINYVLVDKKDRNTVVKYIKSNDSDIDIEIFDISDKVYLKLNMTINSNFGKIVGFSEYKVSTSYIGYLKNDKVIIEEKG